MKALSSRHTVTACYVGYITQAIVNNFAPLLFVTFQTAFDVSLTLLGMLITVNFGVQLCVDLLSAKIVDKLGYRPCMVAAHLFVAAGLLLFALLPGILPQPVVGLFIGSGVYAVGGGLIEVLVSPVVESCPTKNKKAAMSMLHSFYCWGHVAVVALSTLFFSLAGTEHWQVMACIWAAIPLCNAVYFLFVPLFPVVEEGKGMTIRKLFATPVFWLLFVLMFCAGSSEQAVSQWASAFAESGLHVSKVLGDLLGPCLFAVCMGLSRLLYSLFGGKLRMRPSLSVAALGCIGGYALCAFAPASLPVLDGPTAEIHTYFSQAIRPFLTDLHAFNRHAVLVNFTVRGKIRRFGRIMPGKAGIAKAFPSGNHVMQGIKAQIRQGICSQQFCNFLHRVVAGNQILFRRNIGTIIARPQKGRGTDAYMDFFRPRFAEHTDNAFASRTAHNGVIEHNDTLARYFPGNGIEF